MKKILLCCSVLIAITPITMANQIYSSQKLGNGMVINRCRFSNGKVDYCTREDALRAMDVIQHPTKYMSKEQLAKYNSMENRINNIFPLKNEIDKKKTEYEKKRDELSSKAALGLKVDKNYLELLNFKIDVLKQLWDFKCFLASEKEYDKMNLMPIRIGIAMNVSDINSRYGDLFNALDSKKITQAEFNQVKIDLDNSEIILRNIFNDVICLTVIPEEKYIPDWIAKHYPNSEYNVGKRIQNDDFSTTTSQGIKQIQNIKSKVNNASNLYNGVLNGVEKSNQLIRNLGF